MSCCREAFIEELLLQSILGEDSNLCPCGCHIHRAAPSLRGGMWWGGSLRSLRRHRSCGTACRLRSCLGRHVARMWQMCAARSLLQRSDHFHARRYIRRSECYVHYAPLLLLYILSPSINNISTSTRISPRLPEGTLTSAVQKPCASKRSKGSKVWTSKSEHCVFGRRKIIIVACS